MTSHEASLHDHGHNPHLAHHFEDMQQQHTASTLGMWIFLANEVLLFGGMFLAYSVYRFIYAASFKAGQHHLNFELGAGNTAILLFSSFAVAMSIYAVQTNKRKQLLFWVIATMVFGAAFLGVKAYEWYHEYTVGLVPLRGFEYDFARGIEGAPFPNADELKTKTFFHFYFMMTGMHALHMVIGLGLYAWILYRAWRNHFNSEYYAPVEIVGLYWHFVDVVWVFLYPTLYLI